MPVHIDRHTALVHAHRPVVFACFPIPEPEFAISVARYQKLAIRTKLEPTSVARAHMPSEALLSVELEIAVFNVVNDNTVVHGLPCEVLAIRVHGCVGDRMHVRLSDVLGNDRNAELPHEDLLVITGRHEALAVLDESQTVD